MERIKTGIPGLDKLIEGGFIKGHQILLAGETGTGKTIFSCQFLLEGARKGENCFYLTLEEAPESIIKNMRKFSWGSEFEDYVKKGRIKIIRYLPVSLPALTERLVEIFKKGKVERFVLDSLTVAAMGWKKIEEPAKFRRDVFSFIDTLKQFEITSLLISEIPSGREEISVYGFEEFIADAILLLKRFEYAKKEIDFLVLKMRGTNHSREIFNVRIDKNGLKVVEKEKGIVI